MNPGKPRVLVLMATSSPWSHEVVAGLARRGFAVETLDLTAVGEGYLNANAALQASFRADLASHVDRAHIRRLRGPALLRMLRGAWRMRRQARDSAADVTLALYGGAQAAIAFLSLVRPYVVYVVGSDVLLASGLRRSIARVALRAAALVLANGRHLAERTALLAPGARLHELYLGIDVARFRPAAQPGRRAHFVCSRGFSEVYDNATIVRAVGALPVIPSELRVTFLSTGPLLGEVEALAHRVLPPDSRDAVVFIRGVSSDALIGALTSASFYLSASRSDGASASLLEAMACGLFPILSDIPANREWIQHARNGLLFPPGDHEALARCMREALVRPSWMDDAVRYNRTLVVERADSATSLDRLAALLRTAAGREALT